MSQFKILFTGPVGAGKTTAINSISDVPPIKTDAAASDMTKARKPSTTVAMDYGLIHLAGGEKIHLYGTPGQERFDFMWDILVTGGIGLILLLDNTRSDPFQDMKFFLDAFGKFIGE
ncbi:MAG: ATP/GTP-binding protein, partial [Methylicorpusculum sp.]|nr:ATP/GTP-binding protein [Methylicorpusculum sp.]